MSIVKALTELASHLKEKYFCRKATSKIIKIKTYSCQIHNFHYRDTKETQIFRRGEKSSDIKLN